MYCPKCGNKQNSDEKFCPKCGTEFPTSNDYYRTIPSTKEKLQCSIEEVGKSANEIAVIGRRMADNFAQKFSEQASETSEVVKQKLADHNVKTHSDMLKQYKSIFFAACIIIIVGIIFISKGSDDSEDVTSSANTENVQSQISSKKREVTGPSTTLIGRYVHNSGLFVELRNDFSATVVYAGLELHGTWESYNSTDYFEITFSTGTILRFKEIKPNVFINEKGQTYTKQ